MTPNPRNLAPNNALGTCGELRVAADLTAKGYLVSFPAAHTSPYDLVLDCAGQFLRVQCKGAASMASRVHVAVCRGKGKGALQTDTYDILAVFVKSEDCVLYFPTRELIGKKAVRIGALQEIFLENLCF